MAGPKQSGTENTEKTTLKETTTQTMEFPKINDHCKRCFMQANKKKM